MKYIFSLFLLCSLLACKTEFANKKVETAYNSVMEVHDEVMPKISDIQKLKKQLKKVEKQPELVAELKTRLEAADDGMMEWMKDFKLDKKAPVETQLAYLSEEQIKINKVSFDMKDSIKKATEFLNKNTAK